MSLGGLGSTVSSATGSLPVAGATDTLDGLNATDAIGSDGLSVAGLVGLGSNEKNAIDLLPKEKKEAYLERRKNVKNEAEKKALQRKLEEDTGKKVVGQDDEELAERAKKKKGGLGDGLPSTDGVTKGAPLDAAKGVTGDGGGPLDAAKGLTDGPVDTAKGLTSGATDGLPLDAASGLLGGSKGLSVAGLVGLGSDEENAIDLLPAEKQKAFAQRYKNAKSEEEKAELRRKLMKQADNEANDLGLDDNQREALRDVSSAERQEFLRDYRQASPREKAQLSNRLQRQAQAARERKKEETSSSGGKGLGGTGLGGKDPLDTAKGAGGALDGGPMDTVGGLGSGLPVGGGGKGLSVGNLVGLGSDEENAVDLLPAPKRKAFEERWKAAKSEEEKKELRRKLMEQSRKEAEASNIDDDDREALKGMDPESRQRHVQAMREADTPAKRSQVRESMRRTSRTQAGNGSGSAAGGRAMCLPMCTHEASSYESRPSLFYAYLVPSSRGRGQGDSYMLTFANPSVADKWYEEASRSYDVERPGHQFFSYRGDAPKAVSPSISRQMHATRLEGMDCFPVLPLQTVDGYMVGPRYQPSYVVNRSCSSCSSGSNSSTSSVRESEEFRRKMDSYERERREMEQRYNKDISSWEERHAASEERFRERERRWNSTRDDYDERISRLEEELRTQRRSQGGSRTSGDSHHRHSSGYDRDESFDDDWLTDSKHTSSYGSGGRRTGHHGRNTSDSSDDWLDDFDESSSGGRNSKGRHESSDDSWLNESSETHRHKSTREESHSTSSSRKHWTMESMAREHARNQVARGDRRSEEHIYREALEDLRADCTNCH